MPSTLEVADRLFSSIMKGDIDGVRDVYDPACTIWHNNDNTEQNVDQNLRVLAWVVKNIGNLRYEDVRRHETPTGFVQQHVLRGTGPSGKAVEIAACIVCKVENGRITRLDEYLDSAQVTPLFS